MQHNNKCRFCGERDELVNHIVSKCNKVAQKKLKTWYDCVGKEIHLELCKRMKFYHAAKWYMYKALSILENKIHKILWNFEI